MGPQQQQQSEASTAAATADQSTSNGTAAAAVEQPLYLKYPVLSVWEFVLAPNNTQVSGTVFSTDVTSQTIMLLPATAVETLQNNNLNNTATEIRIVNATCIRKAEELKPAPSEDGGSIPIALNVNTPISKKTLEDRERRAIRQAEESFRHMNEKVSSEGQEVFDRLLKACGEVAWSKNATSIIVLNSIQVDSPYLPENCQMLAASGAKNNSSQEALERVKKIVGSVDRNKK